MVAPRLGRQAEPGRASGETVVSGIGPGLPIVERVVARRPRAIVGYDQLAEARAIWVRCDFQRDSAAKGMRDDRRSYRPLEQSGRLGTGQELRQMNLRRVTFPPSRSSHPRPGYRHPPPVISEERRAGHRCAMTGNTW